HPQSVRTAALLGVAAMHQHLPLYHARDAQRGMDLLLAACAEDEGCAAAFPNVAEEFRAVIARLDAGPVRVSFPHPETGAEVTVTMGPGIFVENLRFFTYTPAQAMIVPALIHQAYEGDYELLAPFIVFFQSLLRELIYLGMHLSVVCAEDAPFITPEAVEELTAGAFLGDYRIRQMLDACAVWPRGEIPEGYHEPVRSEAPTLLISGHLDPVTPPSWAEEVAPHLPRGLHLIALHGHHDFSGLSNLDCEEKLLRDFLDRGSAEGLDSSCFSTMERGEFMTDRAQVEEFLQVIMRE
ncbi:MAG: alpha/beta hydrolase, partial [bacterium]|nr:alpha/beta hydrolase [bacterium]